MTPIPKFPARILCAAAIAQCPIPRPKLERNTIDRAKRAWLRRTDEPKSIERHELPRIAARAVADALRIIYGEEAAVAQWAALQVFQALAAPVYTIALEHPKGSRVTKYVIRCDGEAVLPYHVTAMSAKRARLVLMSAHTPATRHRKMFSFYGDISRPDDARAFLAMAGSSINAALARKLGFAGKGARSTANAMKHYADMIVRADDALGNGDIDQVADFNLFAANTFRNDIEPRVIFRNPLVQAPVLE